MRRRLKLRRFLLNKTWLRVLGCFEVFGLNCLVLLLDGFSENGKIKLTALVTYEMLL